MGVAASVAAYMEQGKRAIDDMGQRRPRQTGEKRPYQRKMQGICRVGRLHVGQTQPLRDQTAESYAEKQEQHVSSLWREAAMALLRTAAAQQMPHPQQEGESGQIGGQLYRIELGKWTRKGPAQPQQSGPVPHGHISASRRKNKERCRQQKVAPALVADRVG